MTDSTAPVPGSWKDPGEEALLARALSGDRDAMGSLIRIHQDTVYRFLLALMGDEEDARDLTQDTFVKAMRGLSRYRGEGPLRSWLLTIARNEARTRFKGERRRREEPLDRGPEPPAPEQEGVEEKMLRDSEIRRVRRALARLPEKQRMSVSLRLFDGLGYREIAEATDTTEGSARVNYHHGIRRLRDELERGPETGPEEGGG